MYAEHIERANLQAHVESLTPYHHFSSRGFFAENGNYYVYCYDTMMLEINLHTMQASLNVRKYRVTTSRLQNRIRKALANMPALTLREFQGPDCEFHELSESGNNYLAQ